MNLPLRFPLAAGLLAFFPLVGQAKIERIIEKTFTENLVGVKEDDEKVFTVAYPVEFTSEALAGKTVHYKAKIKSE